MKTLAVDRYNDIYLEQNGLLAIATGATAIGQASVQYSRSRRGEMIHAMDDGVPFDLVAWLGSPNETQFEAVMRTRLLQLPEVLEVVTFEVRHVGDVLNYTATLRTTAGEVVTNG